MFTIPSPRAIISIFYPVGDFKVGYVTKRNGDVKEYDLGFIEARVKALLDVAESCLYALGELSVLGAGIYVGTELVRHF